MLLVLTVVARPRLPAGGDRRRPGGLPRPRRRLARRAGRQGRRLLPDRPVVRRQAAVLPDAVRRRPATATTRSRASASNLGPENPDLLAAIEERRAAAAELDGTDPGRRPAGRADGQRLRPRPAHQPGVRRAAGRPGRPRARPARRPRCARWSSSTPAAARSASSASRASTCCCSTWPSTAAADAGRLGRGTRGRLRVYLGAAPGVGKTYAMLGEGHRRAERGTDVVVGFVETHGRAAHRGAWSTASRSSRGARSTYRGADFTEMDVDAMLARRPKVALVDELAHTNVPGSPQRASAGRTSRSCSPPAST